MTQWEIFFGFSPFAFVFRADAVIHTQQRTDTGKIVQLHTRRWMIGPFSIVVNMEKPQ